MSSSRFSGRKGFPSLIFFSYPVQSNRPCTNDLFATGSQQSLMQGQAEYVPFIPAVALANGVLSDVQEQCSLATMGVPGELLWKES